MNLIFSTEMVPRVLDESKTQTRRTKGLNEINESPDSWEWIGFDNSGRFSFRWKNGDRILNIRCPYGKAGDRLWVREAFAINDRGQVLTKADKDSLTVLLDLPEIPIKWKPSIHMPRWASRIDVENVIDPFPQRLQETSEEDAMAEGVERDSYHTTQGWKNYFSIGCLAESALSSFQSLWNKLNRKRGYGWESNPWVWAISFKKCPLSL